MVLSARCSEVGSWEPIPAEEIIEAYGEELYDSPVRNTRARIDLDHFPPLHDEQGREFTIYTPTGDAIPRFAAMEPEDGPHYCALLPDLPKCRSLFIASVPGYDPDDDDAMEIEHDLEPPSDLDDDDERGDIPHPRRAPQQDIAFQVYPTAFIPTLGNWQAKGIITPLAKHVNTLASHITRIPRGPPAVQGSISQSYNNFTHHTRRSAGQHIVQRGILTGVTAGAWSTNSRTQATASKLFAHVESDLPHKALEQQVNNVDETCLRFENVFVIHMKRLKPALLEGSAFFDSVIQPLIDACGHSDVFNALRCSTTVLRPGVRPRPVHRPSPPFIDAYRSIHKVYPSMLLWTAYPITVLMEEVWAKRIRPVLDSRNTHPSNTLVAANPRSRRAPPIAHLANVPSPEWLELLAMLERCLCFAHTGSAPSLAYALMKRTFTSRSLLEGYLPMFWDGLEIPEASPLHAKLHIHRWPTDRRKEPLLASKRSQILTYGAAHLAVSSLFSLPLPCYAKQRSSFLGLHRVFQDPTPSLQAPRPVTQRQPQRPDRHGSQRPRRGRYRRLYSRRH